VIDDAIACELTEAAFRIEVRDEGLVGFGGRDAELPRTIERAGQPVHAALQRGPGPTLP
jgi:hypothetical protein